MQSYYFRCQSSYQNSEVDLGTNIWLNENDYAETGYSNQGREFILEINGWGCCPSRKRIINAQGKIVGD